MKKTLLLLPILLFILSGCGKNKNESAIKLSDTNISIKSQNTHQLTVLSGNDSYTFRSTEPKIAHVSSSGLITGLIIGEAIIEVSKGAETATCKVTVTNNYEMFREPLTAWGTTTATVKAYETRTLQSEKEKTIVYKGENSTLNDVTYGFSESKLDAILCSIPAKYATLLGGFYAERYEYMGESGDYIIMASLDGKTTVGISVTSESKISVIYVSSPTSKSIQYSTVEYFADRFDELYNLMLVQ